MTDETASVMTFTFYNLTIFGTCTRSIECQGHINLKLQKAIIDDTHFCKVFDKGEIFHSRIAVMGPLQGENAPREFRK